MSDHPLAGAIEKLRRSDVHLTLLYKRVRAYIDTAPYTIETERDPHTGDGLWLFHVTRQPSLHLATLIGDVLHNIRSALDYLAHELIRLNGFPTTNRTQYPICGTTGDFDNEAINQRRLAGISHRCYRRIDAFQPHQMRAPYTFTQHPLWHLHELSNLDKHRALRLSALSTSCAFRFLSRDDTLLQQDSTEGLMYDGAIVGTMPAALVDGKAKIHAKFTIQVSFRDAPVADREVLAVVQSMREFVGEFIFPAFYEFFDPLPDHLKLVSHGVPVSLLEADSKRPSLLTFTPLAE